MIGLVLALQAAPSAVASQALHDRAAAKIAASMHGIFRAPEGVAVERVAHSHSNARALEWRVVTDEDLRLRSSYFAPKGYRFRRSAGVDMDHDGRVDVVQMVERAGRMALRISYGGSGRVAVVNIHDGRWTDQGLFVAGADAVMVNFPESSAHFLFERGGELRIAYAED